MGSIDIQRTSIETSRQIPPLSNIKPISQITFDGVKQNVINFETVSKILGINLQWLKKELQVINQDSFDLNGKHLGKYFWGEPRPGDTYKLSSTNNQFYLHLLRDGKEKVLLLPTGITNIITVTRNSLDDLSDQIINDLPLSA